MFIRPGPDTWIQLSLPWQGLPLALRLLIVALLVVGPTALLLLLYRYELRLVPRLTASALLGLRLLVFALVLLLLSAQPVYARDYRSTLSGGSLVVADRPASLDVPDPQREPADKLRLARALGMTKGIDARLLDQWIEDHEKKQEPRWLLPTEAKDRPELEAARQKQHD